MKRNFLRIGMVLGLLTAIAPSATAQSIPNGKYANMHPDNQWVEIRNNSFSVGYATSSPDPWEPIPKGVFKYIKPGVFYSTANKEYHCLIKNDLERQRNQASRYLTFNCSRNGWIKKYGAKKK